jgi:hypothetical protein
MGSSSSYGYDKYYDRQRADAVERLRKGVDSISDDQTYAATQALDQMKWKLSKLHMTQEEYTEWRGFIDALSRVLPELRK